MVGEQFSGMGRVPIKDRTTCAGARAAGKPGARLSCQTVPVGRKEVVGATSREGCDWAAVPGAPLAAAPPGQDWPIGPAALVSSSHLTTIWLWACAGEPLILCTAHARYQARGSASQHIHTCRSARIAHLNKTLQGSPDKTRVGI